MDPVTAALAIQGASLVVGGILGAKEAEQQQRNFAQQMNLYKSDAKRQIATNAAQTKYAGITGLAPQGIEVSYPEGGPPSTMGGVITGAAALGQGAGNFASSLAALKKTDKVKPSATATTFTPNLFAPMGPQPA